MDQSKTNILNEACEYGHLEVVKELIKYNAPIADDAIYRAKTDEIRDLLINYMEKRKEVA